MKKLLLGLGSVTAALTPVAAVISCADKENAKDATKTDATKTDATKPADKVGVSPLIRKIGKDDKGFVVKAILPAGPDGNPEDPIEFYVSEKNANAKSTVNFAMGKITFPPIKSGESGLKATIHGLAEVPITIKPAPADSYVIGGFKFAKNSSDLVKWATILFTSDTGVNRTSLFKFEFTDATKETKTPVLTDVSKKAFEKIFTDVGLKVTATFARGENGQGIIIAPTITLTP